MRLRDLELLKNIKKQERKAKEAERANQQKDEQNAQAISFEVWWMEFSRKKNLRHHIKEILKSDFKARGLKDMELKEAFDKAATQFGYK